ncbi:MULTISPECIES: PDR/VanB family oxidoreductase [unclassified Bradyrhizobium]|uniref:PDR/VanB family oxidoreductase n=1 Tax=unclassified Bradyrhizobium TaxID=2631580 RepID=UPI001CD46940|nr:MULTISPECIES: PDR/VanB family oxidoreductase [unclassified Bradyrhizobium]MCA1365224.1 oxidoreductase [Bradyrhizobium sp. IC4059]MCA1495153.1 oxidoreductase [Bradyrhizobium sp. NBAIM14]MCA1523076.1 oxidoreductase [Bradyrhizobium sp. IC3069]MCA1530961.1 oxidoreductase [Bradyrhizobium sp. NBAIM03]
MRFIETWTPATLVATRDLTPNVREFLIKPDQFEAAAYPVGSHINVSVTIDGLPETRSYSLVGEASSHGLRIAVRRAEDSRGGSRYMWSLQPGARLDITQPASLLAVDWTRENYCLIAGGIGITPILGAAQALARRGADVTLHYAVRSRREAAYLDDLAAMLGDRLVVHASEEGSRLDMDALFASLPQGTLALFCGPMRMLDAARHAWIGAGHPLPDLRYETFGSSGTLPTETFRVRLKDSGVELEIPRERSMLDVLNASGFEVISDCKRGECGLCAIDVVNVDGEIDHRDVFFSDHEKKSNHKICTCVSRARGTITVDTLLRADAV